MKKNNSFLVITVFLMINLFLSNGCFWGDKKAKAAEETTADKIVAENFIEAFGLVKATNIQNITLDIPTQIRKIYVREGDYVTRDKVLMTLEIDDYAAQINSKANELEEARFGLTTLRQELENAENELQKAEKELTLKKRLYRKGVIAKQAVTDYRKIVQKKKTEVTNIKSDQIQLNKIDIKNDKVKNLEDELEIMQDKLKQNFLQDYKIISPLKNAVVSEIGYRTGDQITSGKKLLSLMDLDSLVVSAEVPEEFIKDIKIGSEATIIPLADNSREFKGRVVGISAMAIKQNNQTIVPIDVELIEANDFLRPNFNVDVQIKKN